MGKITLGIDEAGRGCVIGPLVTAGVIVKPSDERFLTEAGVKDSKKIKSFNRRKELAAIIHSICYVEYSIADSTEVDRAVEKHQLNVEQRNQAKHIIQELEGVSQVAIERIVLDSSNIFNPLINSYPGKEVIATDHAEDKYTAVAAASVCAKNLRDSIVKIIMGDHFKPGSGYPNQWTRKFIELNPGCPHVRKSWSWYKKEIKNEM